MQRTRFGDLAPCSIARTLDVIGEPWSPLILRDVYVGINRFDQLQDDLGRRVMGDELYRSYIDLKKSEWWSYHNSISQWEIDEYLTKF